MSGISVTTNMSQRIGRPLVHLPPSVTFNLSQLAAGGFGCFGLRLCGVEPNISQNVSSHQRLPDLRIA
jgi:hypothetical protein